MNTTMLRTAAAAISIAWAASATAQEGPPPGFQMPDRAVGLMNMGKAGVLTFYIPDELYGLVGGRMGTYRGTISMANQTGITTGYEDGLTNYTFPLNLFKGLDDKSFLRFTARGILSKSDSNQVSADTDIVNGQLQYLRFPTPTTMLSFGLTYENSSASSDNTVVDHEGIGLRADGAAMLDQNWSVYGRALYLWGNTETNVDIMPGLKLNHKQDDESVYGEAVLVGQFRDTDIGFLPDQWVLHPSFGLLYLHTKIEETADSFGNVSSGVLGPTEKYGLAFTELQLEKEVAPSNWSPYVTLGYQNEFENSLGAYIDEENYGVLRLGLSRTSMAGNRIELTYSRYQGFNGNRYEQNLTAALTFVF